MSLFALMGIGGQELLLIMLVVLILFGAKKIPEFARGLGQGIREFRRASREIQEEIERAAQQESVSSPPHYGATPTGSEHQPQGASFHAGEQRSASGDNGVQKG